MPRKVNYSSVGRGRQRVAVYLNEKGVAEVLKSDGVGAALEPYAQGIANHVRAKRGGVDVVVDSYTTDRIARSVTVREYEAGWWHVKDGDLIQAAAAQGLEVTENKKAEFTRLSKGGKRRVAKVGSIRRWDRGKL